jgi:uncharacterized membrane protein
VNYNPYAAPQAPAPPPSPHGGFGPPQPWTASEVLSVAWARFKVHGGILIFAYFAFSIVIGVVAQLPNIFTWTHVVDAGSPAAFGIIGGGTLMTQAVSAFFYVGLSRIWLDVARGNTPKFETMFSGADRFLPMLGLNLLLGLAVAIGCVLFIVPGVIAMLIFQLAPYYVVEGRMGPIDAMQKSWETTRGQRGELFVLALAGLGLTVLGVVMCCVGMMVTFPLYWLATAVAFTRVAGMSVGPMPMQQGPVQPPYGGQPGGPHDLPPWR